MSRHIESVTATTDAYGRIVLDSGIPFDVEHFQVTAVEPFSGTKHVASATATQTGARAVTARVFVRDTGQAGNPIVLAANMQVTVEFLVMDATG